MKAQIALPVFFLFVFLSDTVTVAQLTFTAADAAVIYAIGNVHTNYYDSATTVANIGAPGGGNFWNIGNVALAHIESIDTVAMPSSTPYYSDYPNSNVALDSRSLQPPYDIDQWQYASLDSSGLKAQGSVSREITDTLTVLSTVFLSPFWLDIPLPFTYGSHWSNTYTAQSTTYHNGNVFSTRTYQLSDSAVVDAYGSMAIPNGQVLPTLRLRRVSRTYRPDGSSSAVISYLFVTELGDFADVTAADTLQPQSGLISGVIEFHTASNNRTLSITKPAFHEVVPANSHYGIQWIAPGIDSVKLNLSLDSGRTFRPFVPSYPANAGGLTWIVPDTLSSKCFLSISDVAHPSDSVVSPLFKVKGYVLTRFTEDGSYEKFTPRLHGWSFINDTVPMWPASWWSQFDYETGNDPFTGVIYPYEFDQYKARSSNFIDWPLYVNAFGTDQCYWSTDNADYKQTAILRWVRFRDSTFKGSCEGFALSSLLAFSLPTALQDSFPTIGSFTDLNQLPVNSDRRKIINQLYFYQYGREHIRFTNSNAGKKPRETLADLKQMLLSDIQYPSVLRIADTTDGHSLAPYELYSANADTFVLRLYDCNHPNDSTFAIIDSLHNSWFYPDLGWRGDSVFYLAEPVNQYLPHPITSILGKSRSMQADSVMEIYAPPSAVLIRAQNGGTIGWSGTSVINTMAGAGPIRRNTSKNVAPIGYLVPNAQYSAKLTGFSDSSAYVTSFTDSVVYDYSRNDARPSQSDYVNLANGMSVANRDNSSKRQRVFTIIPSDTLELSFDLSNIISQAGDSLAVRKTSGQNFTIANVGRNKSYDLRLKLGSRTRKIVFLHTAITLDSNSTHRIVPPWNGLSTQPVKILIDRGNHGTFNDSMLVTNQATGVNQQPGQGVPTVFTLEQNYPNPFNPSTTIRYALPQTSHVTLRVYNMLGQQVAQLVNEQQGVGYHDVVFNAGGLASGVYFYSLQAGDYIATKKLLLLK